MDRKTKWIAGGVLAVAVVGWRHRTCRGVWLRR